MEEYGKFMPNFAADSIATGSAPKPLERSSLGSFGYIAVSPHLRTTWIFPLIIPAITPFPRALATNGMC